MTGQFRGARGVEQLLKLARGDVEALRIDLADIETAKRGAEAALAETAEALAREEQTPAEPGQFAAFREAMTERRFNLRSTISSLEAAAEAARGKLAEALGEIAKLERVAEANAREQAVFAKRRAARQEAEAPTNRRRA